MEKLPIRRRKRPLKTDMYLCPISAVEGFPACKRRVIKKYKQAKAIEKRKQGSTRVSVDKIGGTNTDSSSEDEEYDRSSSYSEIRRQQSAMLKSRMKQNPPKSVHTTVTRDLWLGDGELRFHSHTNLHTNTCNTHTHSDRRC